MANYVTYLNSFENSEHINTFISIIGTHISTYTVRFHIYNIFILFIK